MELSLVQAIDHLDAAACPGLRAGNPSSTISTATQPEAGAPAASTAEPASGGEGWEDASAQLAVAAVAARVLDVALGAAQQAAHAARRGPGAADWQLAADVEEGSDGSPRWDGNLAAVGHPITQLVSWCTAAVQAPACLLQPLLAKKRVLICALLPTEHTPPCSIYWVGDGPCQPLPVGIPLYGA